MERARDHWFTVDVRPDGSSGGPIDPPVHERRFFLQDYATLATGDLLSLTFCCGWRATQSAEGYAVTLAGSELCVDPDPFGGRRLPIQVRARRLQQRRFDSDADLRAALAAAPEEMLCGFVVGRAGSAG
jgi:hypothetical protein